MHCAENEPLWYALYTRPRAEKEVHSHLLGQEIESFLPIRKSVHQWCDRKRTIEAPLIPSYVFVRTTTTQFQQVLETTGVIRFIFYRGRPARIREHEIDILRKAVEVHDDAEICIGGASIAYNKRCKIEEGPFAGYEGIIVQSPRKNRIALLIEELGVSVVVSMPMSILSMCV